MATGIGVVLVCVFWPLSILGGMLLCGALVFLKGR